MIVYYSSEITEAKRQWNVFSKLLKGKLCQLKFRIQQKIFKMKMKLRYFQITKSKRSHSFLYCVKEEVFQAEEK